MNTQLNINQLSGKIVGIPEFRETKSGKNLLTFNFMYPTKNTTDSEGSHINFIQIEIWGNIAKSLSNKLDKSNELIVKGEIVQKRWVDENGKSRSNFIFNATSVLIAKEYGTDN